MKKHLAPDLKHFNYSHLRPELQAASKLFHDFVHGEMTTGSFAILVDKVTAVLPLEDYEGEAVVAAGKLVQAREMFAQIADDYDGCLRLILEAKDCAVRSLLDK